MNWFHRRAAATRAIWNPNLFHGWNRSRSFFEGWYFKVVNANETSALAFIPGISIDPEGDKFAFVQVLDGIAAKSYEYRYPAGSFSADPRRFSVQVADSNFSLDRLQINLPDFQGTLELSDPFPWPSSWRSPGVMGWYSFVPFMECYHGIVSMDHGLAGALKMHHLTVNFDGGRGYAEKDWGTSFPRCWIWGQSNHFAGSPGTSVMFSVAHIPWRGSYFVGFLAGLLHQDKLYSFTTHNKTQAILTRLDRGVTLIFNHRDFELAITARQAEGADLLSPIEGSMIGKVNESMQATFDVSLKHLGSRIFTGQGTSAGMEIAGDTDILFQDLAAPNNE